MQLGDEWCDLLAGIAPIDGPRKWHVRDLADKLEFLILSAGGNCLREPFDVKFRRLPRVGGGGGGEVEVLGVVLGQWRLALALSALSVDSAQLRVDLARVLDVPCPICSVPETLFPRRNFFSKYRRSN